MRRIRTRVGPVFYEPKTSGTAIAIALIVLPAALVFVLGGAAAAIGGRHHASDVFHQTNRNAEAGLFRRASSDRRVFDSGNDAQRWGRVADSAQGLGYLGGGRRDAGGNPGGHHGHGAGTTEGGYWWTVEATAYDAGACCCGKWADGNTASGRPARGLAIAAPPGVPFGTWIQVPGYGRAEVLDRGGAIKGDRIDLLMPTHDQALQWGRKKIIVWVETP